MLTSGSTGHAKAVELRHDQVIAAVRGKIDAFGSSIDDVFLNWIGKSHPTASPQLLLIRSSGFDHVACVTEMHLHAVMACANDVHVSPVMFMQDPLLWLRLMEKHSVTHSFSPNFFLSALCKALDNTSPRPSFDLSRLRRVVSGGEANVVSTGIAFNSAVQSMGAPDNVLKLAFGMTEVRPFSTPGRIHKTLGTDVLWYKNRHAAHVLTTRTSQLWRRNGASNFATLAKRLPH